MWLTHPNFMEVVSTCWTEHIVGDPSFVFQQKLKKLKNFLRERNWNVFGNINVKIKEAEEEVHRAMILSDNNPSDTEALDRLVNAENNYNFKEVQLKIMLQQKARIKWVKEGSTNTSFFHTNLKIKQSRNFISELEDVNEEADSLLEVIPEVIIEEDQQMLDAVPNAEEIKDAIFSMDPDSSPGPDGFTGFMVNGGPHGFFSVGRGLRQGDPLSPTLFVIIEDVLSRCIHKIVQDGMIAPMVVRKGEHPTHLFFVDDVFIFCNGAKKSLDNLIKLLNKYQKGSGQIINKAKSKLFIDGTSNKGVYANGVK
ncbi:uncharacterized protein LOC113316173 [Papaver somniferum]|uniref:uncharacterized protein LOC113316173 n=1 Tax=Papaver somniferum TaxID=3469 RepID=UPI000E70502D|nr:uncharacterized protein LOC113316173 [Papaver somniferum]